MKNSYGAPGGSPVNIMERKTACRLNPEQHAVFFAVYFPAYCKKLKKERNKKYAKNRIRKRIRRRVY